MAAVRFLALPLLATRPSRSAIALCLLAVLVASRATADPELTFDPAPLGDGLVGWNVGIAFDDDLPISTFIDVTFEGPFEHIPFDGMDVDTDEDASEFDGQQGYDAAFDSYFITSVWPDVIVLEGGEVMSVVYDFAAGSGAGSQIVDFIELAYLVLPEGEVPFYDAIVSRAGVNYHLVPEPGATSLAFAAIGALAALRRRRGRRDGFPRSAMAPGRRPRRLFSALLSLLAAATLTACGSPESDDEPDAPEPRETSSSGSAVVRSTGPTTLPERTAGPAPTPKEDWYSEDRGTAPAATDPPGDANGDGRVDDEDYTLLAEHFGESVEPDTLGDVNGDGVVDGADYTLWADNYGAGTDPCADDPGTDTDGDGLSDCVELTESLTLPDVSDTDGDGRSDQEEWLLFDPVNTYYVFNPRIADLPEVAVDLVQLPVVEIDYQISGSATETIGTEFSSSSTESITTGRGGAISQQVSFAHSVSASVMVGAEVGVSSTGAEAKYKSELTVGFEATQTESQGSTVNWNTDETAERTEAYQDSETASQTEGFTYSGGRLSAVIEIRNPGGVSYQISNLFLTAQLADPLRPLAIESIGTMQFDGDEPFVAQVQQGQAVGPFSYTIPDLTLGRAQQLMRDRREIAVAVGSYILEDINGTSTLLREDDVNALTATVIVDYGAGSGRIDRFRVAVRQATGEKSISALAALEDILGLDVAQGTGTWMYPEGSSSTPFGLKRIGTYALSASTNRYWQVAHNHNNESGTLARTTDSLNLVLGEFDLEEIELRAGDNLVLSYVGDEDRDGIPDGAETEFGTDPSSSDTDGDGLLDAEEVYGWLTNLASPPCDQGELFEVFSNPLSVDSDGDGERDDVEKAACQNPSADFVADAGPDQDVNIESTVQLIGSFTGQATETPSYSWQVIEGPPVFSDGVFTETLEGQNPRFTAPSDVLTLTFELTITIGDLQQKDQVNVNVFENLATAIFVGAVNEDGIEIGTQANPYGTLEVAHSDHPEADLYVMTQEQVYELESPLIMDSGVSIYGGYDGDWIRNAADNKSGVLVNFYGDFQSAIYYDEVVAETTVSGLAITGVNRTNDSSSSVVAIMVDPASPQIGSVRVLDNDIEVPSVHFEEWFDRENLPGSSYGMFIRGLATLEVRNNTVFSGAGGPGTYGPRGSDGARGTGFDGGTGGNGKSSGLFPGSGSAGSPGDNNKSGSCSDGGAAGTSGVFTRTPPGAGKTGCSGSAGTHGAGVVGRAFEGNDQSVPPLYVPRVGAVGGDGENGSGGGGGGGGAADSFSSGGKGGTGGKGGGGGKAGGGAASGGASIGIWLHEVQDVKMLENSISSAVGGDGGLGGSGGLGGFGNSGGSGGASSGNAERGASGGAGGRGGRGGDGGSGHGGPSIAVFVDRVHRSISIDGNQMTTLGGGPGGWASTNAGAGGGGDSFGVYLHSQANGTPSMGENEFTIGPPGTARATPGASGETSWQ